MAATAARACSALVVAEPPLDDTVGQIVTFLEREGLVTAPAAQKATLAVGIG